jgi:organic hydroperoxide reductase OsmC/OhrA
MSHTFAATIEWTGAQKGPTSNYEAYSREYAIEMAGKPTLINSSAPVYGGDRSLHNPEDLLVAAISGCHLLSYLALCARRGIEVVSYRDECSAKMEVSEGKMRFVQATLHPMVEISKGDPTLAQDLHDEAHAQCFIASSVNFPIFCDSVVAVRQS